MKELDELRLIEILQAIVGKLPNDPEWADEGIRSLQRQLDGMHYRLRNALTEVDLPHETAVEKFFFGRAEISEPFDWWKRGVYTMSKTIELQDGETTEQAFARGIKEGVITYEPPSTGDSDAR